MLVSVMSPLIYWLIKRLGMIPILILFVGWILSDNNYTKLFALYFFSFGAYFSIKKIDIITFLKSNRIIPLVFLLLIGVVTFMDTMSINMYYLYDFYIIIGILGVIYWASQFVDKQSISNCRFFVSASFLIYVAHTLIEGKIRQFLVLLCGADNTITLLLVYFIPVILSTVVLMGVYYVIKRYFSWGLFCLGGR